jgi:hypothetical protein
LTQVQERAVAQEEIEKPDRDSVEALRDELDTALRDVGVILPSLWIERGYAAEYAPFAVVLGRCSLDTARTLINVLQVAKREVPPPLNRFRGKKLLTPGEREQLAEDLCAHYRMNVPMKILTRECGRSHDTVRELLELGGETIRCPGWGTRPKSTRTPGVSG